MQINVQYNGTYQSLGNLQVYSLEQAGVPSVLYFAFAPSTGEPLPITPLCRVTYLTNAEFAQTLGTPIADVPGTFKIDKYRVYLNDASQANILLAHYGKNRAGGLNFAVTDLLAADISDWLYMIDMYVIDLVYAFANYQSQLAAFNLVQGLSFDFGGYTDGRRTSLQAINSNTDYHRLGLRLNLFKNDLLINCQDTAGVQCATSIAKSLGIAEESMVIDCLVKVTGLNANNEVAHAYTIVAANEDYGDAPMHVILPYMANDIIAAKIDVQYRIKLDTVGNTIVIESAMILTNAQMLGLHQLTLQDLRGVYDVIFIVKNSAGQSMSGVTVTMNQQTVQTDANGEAIISVRPGTYIYQITYGSIQQSASVTVSSSTIVNAVLDTTECTMVITVIGTDNLALPNIAMIVNDNVLITNENGQLVLRGAAGQDIILSHQLGETLHQYRTELQSGSEQIDLFNTFDTETQIDDGLT